MKRVVRAALVLALLIGSAAVAPPRAELVEEIVAWVNGQIITRSELEEEEQMMIAEAYRRYTGEELDNAVNNLRATMLIDIVDRKILLDKAAMLYEAIDGSSLYKPVADRGSRSTMNVTFTMGSDELTDRFVAEAKERSIVGIKGHRSVGGLRASIYNAVPEESVEALTSFMKEFEREQA